MQGGHPDDGLLDLVPGAKVGRDGVHAEIEAELSLPSFRLVKTLEHSSIDRAIQTLRHMVAMTVGSLIALSTGYSSVEAFQRQKAHKVAVGSQTVRWVQTYRNGVLDVVLAGASFCAEEEFYLLTLPILYWNLDWALGYHMLYVVCAGLFLGNFLKDVFQLPRPTGVWRSSAAAATDSTACQDFGFPSTHTMNSISNAGFCVLYAFDPMELVPGVATPWVSLPAAIGLALIWIVVISGGRLYLGVHSPTDLRGGAVLGLLMSCWYLVAPGVYSWTLHTPYLGLKMWCLTWALLLLCPQVRPATPSFQQNAVCVGLLMGNVMGGTYHAQLIASHPRQLHVLMDILQDNAMPDIAASAIRYIAGLAFVVAMRAVVKLAMCCLVQLFGARVKPAPGQGVLSLRGTDLGALAFQKVVVYFTVSFCVSFVCPALFHMFGLYR